MGGPAVYEINFGLAISWIAIDVVSLAIGSTREFQSLEPGVFISFNGI